MSWYDYVLGAFGFFGLVVSTWQFIVNRNWSKKNIDIESEALAYKRVEFFENEFKNMKQDLEDAKFQIAKLTNRIQAQENKVIETEAQRVAALARLANLIEERDVLRSQNKILTEQLNAANVKLASG